MDCDIEIGQEPCQTLMEYAFLAFKLQRITPEEARDRRYKREAILRCGEWISYTDSMSEMDYRVWFPQALHSVSIDAKDKRIFIPQNWGLPDDQRDDWFVMDETAVKKMANAGFRGFIVFNDYDTKKLYLWNSQAIALGHRAWAMRTCNEVERKYKLLYYVSSAMIFDRWEFLFSQIVDWVNRLAKDWSVSGSRHTWYNPDMVQLRVNTQYRTEEHRAGDLARQGGGISE